MIHGDPAPISTERLTVLVPAVEGGRERGGVVETELERFFNVCELCSWRVVMGYSCVWDGKRQNMLSAVAIGSKDIA